MRATVGVSRRLGRLLRGGVMLLAGALGVGACNTTSTPVYGAYDAGWQACSTDDLCRHDFGDDWYCELSGGRDAGVCAIDDRHDGGVGD